MKCAFCQKDRKLTREHVLPHWLASLDFKKSKIVNKIDGEVNIPPWESNIFQHKTKVVCAECNNGWMSQLESRAKHIITEMIELKELTLDSTNQEVLSVWAQKTILMLNRSVPGKLNLDQNFFDDIYQEKKPSKKIHVNLGWRISNSGTINEPISYFEIKQVSNISVKKDILENVKRMKDEGGYVWRAVLVIGPITFEFIGHNMKVSLEVCKGTEILKSISPYETDIQWPLESPIEAIGGLNALKSEP